MHTKRLFGILALGLGLTLALLWLLKPAHGAAESDAIRCVKPGGGDGCYASIQAAVDAANDGDTIRVAQGVYLETVAVSKSVTLEGGWSPGFTTRNWDVYITTIDAQRAGPVIWVNCPVSPTIEGFMITGGDATSTGLGWGGGINVYPPFPGGGVTSIRHNVITNNVGCSSCSAIGGQGGGIHVYNSSIAVEQNTIISNAARTGGDGGGQGGGVCVGWMAGAILTGNLIVSNTAVFSPTSTWTGQGGGVYVDSHDVTLCNNEIRDNVAAVTGTGQGGGVYAEGVSLHENRILSNSASISGTGEGGGLYADWVQDVADNLVQGNWASRGGDGSGGGIYAVQLQDADRNTIVDNRAKRGGGLYLCPYSYIGLRDNFIARNWATGDVVSTYDGGGGISSADGRATIVGNTIVSNAARLAGGGILVTAGDEYRVQDNRIQGNAAYAGGGLYVYSATGAIVHNQVINNGAVWWGGGMYLWGKASPLMDSNVVVSNTAWGFAGFAGGGIIVNVEAGTRVTLTNHIIARNTISTGVASGVHCVSGACALIHCTIVDNRLGSGRGDGVRISAVGDTNVLWNSVIAGHSTGVVISGGVTALLDYNDYYDNAVADVSGASLGAHSRTDDPQFEDRAARDYHLISASVLIDHGDSALSTPRDFEGDPRLNLPDIGADEYIRAHIYLPLVLRNFSEYGPGAFAP
jgi:hypothetical protein